MSFKSVGIKIGITSIFRFHCRPIQLIVFVPVGVRSTKGLQGQIQLIEGTMVKPENKGNSNFDSNW